MNTGDFLIQERNMSTLGNLLYGKHYFRSSMHMVVSDCYHSPINLELFSKENEIFFLKII